MPLPEISVVIPALEEEASLPAAIRSCREAGRCEVVVADGGSRDRTAEVARELADTVVAAPRGRAVQMNAGAAAARGTILLFLHADTLLPPDSLPLVADALGRPGVVGGAFRIRLAASPAANGYTRTMLRVTARMINLRSRAARSYTGDQAIFLHAAAFRRIGGYPAIPLMEDVELSRRMRREGKTVLLDPPAATSGRRWEAWGPFRAILRMWSLRVGYRFGMSPERCAARYRGGRAPLTTRDPEAPRSGAGESAD
jgi:rSAM/selenodomain-associated transferase 2